MKPKHSFVLIAVLLLVFILSACSNNTATNAATDAAATGEPVLAPTDTETGQASETSPAGATATSDAEALAAGKKLVQERCSLCHSLDRVESKRASFAQWEQTVERMIANGAQLTDKEKKLVVEYLAATYPE